VHLFKSLNSALECAYHVRRRYNECESINFRRGWAWCIEAAGARGGRRQGAPLLLLPTWLSDSDEWRWLDGAVACCRWSASRQNSDRNETRRSLGAPVRKNLSTVADLLRSEK